MLNRLALGPFPTGYSRPCTWLHQDKGLFYQVQQVLCEPRQLAHPRVYLDCGGWLNCQSMYGGGTKDKTWFLWQEIGGSSAELPLRC